MMVDPLPEPDEPVIEVIHPGALLSMQDLGRPGYKRRGVPVSGAMDWEALEWANRLVGNLTVEPALEILYGGCRLKVLRACRIAIAGPAALGRIAPNSSEACAAGEELQIEPRNAGVWSYIAVPGGFAGEVFLGSSSAYLRAGIGTVPGEGHLLNATRPELLEGSPNLCVTFVAPSEVVDYAEVPSIPIWKGPQWDSFSKATRGTFIRTQWAVSNQSDRVGYRLEGPPLGAPPGNMISEPVVPGVVQLPPSGQPVVMMRDAPTIGGYPKIGIVDPAALSRLAQVAPGCRFGWNLCDDD